MMSPTSGARSADLLSWMKFRGNQQTYVGSGRGESVWENQYAEIGCLSVIIFLLVANFLRMCLGMAKMA